MNIFVGNLSFEAAEDDIKKLFEGFGNVVSVVILKRKEKKAPKSRGFGFVDMPDEQQALAAIAGINGKEFMGRVINVEPARPKVETKEESKPKKKRESEKARPFGQHLALSDGKYALSGQHLALSDGKYALSGQHLALSDGKYALSGQPRPGSYKGGRRSVSYMKRQGLVTGAQQDTNPRRRNQENPMRWRKRADQPKPWQKSPGERKPWEKAEGEFKPWRKADSGTKPWKKPTGEARPWKKPTGEARPWKKPTGEARPWSKSSESPQKFKFKGRRKPGGYKQ
jgi:hypothetical protein